MYPKHLLLWTIVTLLTSARLVNCENETSKIDGNELGMGVLYDMVHVFLGDVIQTKNVSDSFLNLSTIFVDGEFDTDQIDEPKDWMDYMIGFTVCAIIGAIFIVAMPIIGIIFCCCRCCGKCGAKKKVHESKRAKCKRRSYCTILLILNTVALAGVVCAFICNSLIYKNLQNDDNEGSAGHIKQSLVGVERFINDSVEDISAYVTNTFDKTSQEILDRVNKSSVEAVDQVLKTLNAEKLLNDAKNISKEVNKTREHLEEVGVLLSNLSAESTQLRDNLTDIKNDISAVCQSSCPGFDPNQYDTTADFSSLDKLSNESRKVAESLDMYKYIVQAEETIDKAKEDAAGQVSNIAKDAENAIADVKKTIQDNVNDLREKKNDAVKDFPKVYKDIDDTDEDVQKISKYIYYGGIGVCCVYLLIVFFYYMGVLFGLSGERPGHGAPCCNTGTGSCFLMAGVAFTFIFSWLLMILCVVLFATGGAVYTEGCRYFNGHNPQEFSMYDRALVDGFDIASYYNVPSKELSMVKFVESCQKNQAVYSALKLDLIVDLDTTMDTTSLERELEDLKTETINVPNITIISTQLENDLLNFAKAGLNSVPFSDYFDELNKQLTAGSLPDMIRAVEGYASVRQDPTEKATLQKSADRLSQLNSETLPSMREKVSSLRVTLQNLQRQSSIESSINNLIADMMKAQDDFNGGKQILIQNEISDLSDDILNFTKAEVERVKKEIRDDRSRCAPLSTALYTMSDSVCVMIVDPLNGLWFSFGWCLFFFVPCLIFAVLLASQYRREHEYEKDFDDPNYHTYGGHSNDTIPLTSLESQPRQSASSQYHPQPGLYNGGYREDYKGSSSGHAPPPYDYHMQQGIDAYELPMYNGRQHHDLANAYPALHGGGSSNGKGYSYPY